MADKMKSKHEDSKQRSDHSATDAQVSLSAQPNLKDPHVVLSLLEADQVVAAKNQTRFGERKLSRGMRVLLWGLRLYVVIMLVIVAISVIQALHSAH